MKAFVLFSLLVSAYAYSVVPSSSNSQRTVPVATKSYGGSSTSYGSSAPIVVINKNANDDVPVAPPQPYQFNYAVEDAETANRFQQEEKSDGRIVSGSYRVALPDGRIQNVRYTATPEGGFVAEVTFEGEARYPEEPVVKKQATQTKNAYPTLPRTNYY